MSKVPQCKAEFNQFFATDPLFPHTRSLTPASPIAVNFQYPLFPINPSPHRRQFPTPHGAGYFFNHSTVALSNSSLDHSPLFFLRHCSSIIS